MRTHPKSDLRIIFKRIFIQEPIARRSRGWGVVERKREKRREREGKGERKEGRKGEEGGRREGKQGGKLLYANLVLFIERNVCPERQNNSKPVGEISSGLATGLYTS